MSGVRFLHAEVSTLAAFVAVHGSLMFSCDAKGKRDPQPAAVEELDAYLAESNKLWGLAPKHFMWVGKEQPHRESLSAAVQRIEESGSDSQAVFAAYQDGGIISVTREKQSFQSGARPADWWRVDGEDWAS